MKSTLFAISLFFSFCLLGQSVNQTASINWMTWQEMVTTREKDSTKKKVYIDMYTDWCGWCKKMDASTFKDPSVVSYMNEKYYTVKMDAEMLDTIVFNGHTFTNSEPNYVKPSPKSRGKTHWLAYSLLDGAMSYPSYAILDENMTRIAVYPGYKTPEQLLGILLFFGANQYQQYHNYLNKQWNNSLKQQQEQNSGK